MDQYCSCIYMKHTDPDGVLPNYDDVQRLHQRKTECWHTLTGNRGSDGVGVETLTNIDDRDRVDATAVLGERGLVWEVELAARCARCCSSRPATGKKPIVFWRDHCQYGGSRGCEGARHGSRRQAASCARHTPPAPGCLESGGRDEEVAGAGFIDAASQRSWSWRVQQIGSRGFRMASLL